MSVLFVQQHRLTALTRMLVQLSTKVDLSTKKLRLDWEVSTEALEDNIEGAALEDHLVRLMTGSIC